MTPSVPRPALPIDAAIPDALRALAESRTLVVEAAPGAGKTTRLPLALLEHGFATHGEIRVLEPRRIAARAAAHHVAGLLGESVGERCGYRVRFEAQAGPRTRLVFETEGLLARVLRDDPDLLAADVVVLDEAHERHLATDLALALLRRAQARRAATDRPLRLVLMSATIDGAAIAQALSAPLLQVPGRQHPVSIRHLAPDELRPRGAGAPHALSALVARAVRSVLRECADGHLLIFLPGAREIRETGEACAAIAAAEGLEVCALHGELSLAEQARVLAPSVARRLVLATNVAETSLTIDGVVAVIDSGLARVPEFDAGSGLPRLRLAKVDRASCAQRAGRAGRTRAGLCLRLYTREDHAARAERERPEIARLDLAPLLLDLHAAGVRDPAALDWLDAPPAAALVAGAVLLERLGVLDASGAMTEIGRSCARVPAHPRIARLLIEAQRLGVPELGAAAAALLAEGRGSASRAGNATLWTRCDLAREAETMLAGRSAGVSAHLRAVTRQFRAMLAAEPSGSRPRARSDEGAASASSENDAAVRAAADEESLARALLVAFPDRVARARTDATGERTLALAGGGSATLARESGVRDAEWIVALVTEERTEGTRGRRVLVRSAAAIEPEWLLEAFADRIEERTELHFDAVRERVEGRASMRYDGLVLDDTPLRTLPAEAGDVLRDAALAAGPSSFVDPPGALEAWLARVAFAASIDPAIPSLDEAAARTLLAELCTGRGRFAELREADLLGQLEARLGSAASRLHLLAPSSVALAGGRKLRVHYPPGAPPFVESRLQDFFGSADGPRIGGGRVPLVLHLLAPNGRALQVTTDLAGFWSRHYTELRRALERRYPRHAWPEDPLRATPPAPRVGRRGV